MASDSTRTVGFDLCFRKTMKI